MRHFSPSCHEASADRGRTKVTGLCREKRWEQAQLPRKEAGLGARDMGREMGKLQPHGETEEDGMPIR